MTGYNHSRRRIPRFGLILFSFLAILSVAQGQQPVKPGAMPAITLPQSPIEEAEKSGSALPISLKELTRLALQNNLDIAISDTNERLFKQRVVQAFGPYDPALAITLGTQSTRRPNTNLTNQSTQGNFNKTSQAIWNFQFTQNLPTGGGITGTYDSSRNVTNQQYALFGTQYSTSLTFQVTQPLLRNRKTDQIRGTIKLANLDTRMNDSQFKQMVTGTIATIQGMYWDLVGAIRDYEIRRDSVKLAQISLDNNIKKVEIGVQPKISITEARAEVANRQVTLITARKAIIVAENNLRAVISPDRNAEIWQKVIVPTEAPEFQEYKAEVESAIQTALKNRPELEQFNLQSEENSINLDLSKNSRKWQVDAVGSFGTIGAAGIVNTRVDQNTADPRLIGGIGIANTKLFTGGFTNWFAGVNFVIPLRNRAADSQIAQLKIQRQQIDLNRANTEQRIAVQVRNAIEDLEANKQRVQTAQAALQLSQEQLDGETMRFTSGMSQNFLVLQRQQDLANAKNIELQALIAYKKSVIQLQQAMYTLLESSDFVVRKSGR
jgi:outer membrane protein TolC